MIFLLCRSRASVPAPTRFEGPVLPPVKSAGLNASWTETYTLETAAGQGATSNEAKVMVYNKNLLAGKLHGCLALESVCNTRTRMRLLLSVRSSIVQSSVVQSSVVCDLEVVRQPIGRSA